jgi:hypothetical protein
MWPTLVNRHEGRQITARSASLPRPRTDGGAHGVGEGAGRKSDQIRVGVRGGEWCGRRDRMAGPKT